MNFRKLHLKLLMLTVFSVGLSGISKAQVSEGSIIIDPYYGFPNFGKAIAQELIDASGEDLEEVRISGIGPMGLRAEYMLADQIGLGFDIIYNSWGATFDIDSTGSDGVTRPYETKLTMSRIRVQARINYHFVTSDQLDAYVGFGAGYNNRVYSLKTELEGYDDSNLLGSEPSSLPASARVALGMRYYLTENIGLNGELGLGGPLLSAGVSIKF